jgi:hypothetical protein
MWDNAAQLHGGGDAKLYICDDVRAPNIIGCRGVLPNNALNSTNSQVVCPHCCKVWRAEELVGEVYYKLPIEKWADVLYQWFLALEMRADIRLKYNQTNRRTATERELEKKLQGDILERATDLRDKSSVIYPLRNIIKDTSAGADLRKRILAFLRA